jgi:hypothetical protein
MMRRRIFTGCAAVGLVLAVVAPASATTIAGTADYAAGISGGDGPAYVELRYGHDLVSFR